MADDYRKFIDEDIAKVFDHWDDKKVAQDFLDRMTYYFGRTDGTYDLTTIGPINEVQMLRMGIELAHRILDK